MPVPRCARPVATRAAARDRCVTLSSARSALDVAPAPAQRRLGRDLAPPGSRFDPASRPRGPSRCPDAALRTARAPPIGRRSALNGAPAVGQRPSNGRVAPISTLPRPGSPAQRPRRGDQRSMACSRCGAAPISALQVPAQGCGDVHERLGAAGSRSAVRHQRRSAPRCAFAGGSRPVRRAGSRSISPVVIAQGPPAGTPAPPLSSRPPLGAGAPPEIGLDARRFLLRGVARSAPC